MTILTYSVSMSLNGTLVKISILIPPHEYFALTAL